MEEIESIKQIEEIDKKIQELKDEKKRIQEEDKRRKMNENKKLRLKSGNNGRSNVNTRVSVSFDNEACKDGYINNKRTENGFDALSYPKITDLIIKHKLWDKIKQDIIHYNTGLDNKENEEEFNDK